MKRFFLLSLIAYVTVLTSCKNDILYSQFHSISSNNWHVDSIVHFDYTIADTTHYYNMQIYIRHTERYPYQNIWLYLGDSTSVDSMNVYLADERGKWYGDSNNGFIEVAVPFGKHLHFADTGTYHLAIQHGMRDSVLRGVTEVGLELSKE